MTDVRSNFASRLGILLPIVGTMALFVVGCSSTGNPSGGLANLIPGRKEAELRSRVDHDSFPTMAEAMRTPANSEGNR